MLSRAPPATISSVADDAGRHRRPRLGHVGQPRPATRPRVVAEEGPARVAVEHAAVAPDHVDLAAVGDDADVVEAARHRRQFFEPFAGRRESGQLVARFEQQAAILLLLQTGDPADHVDVFADPGPARLIELERKPLPRRPGRCEVGHRHAFVQVDPEQLLELVLGRRLGECRDRQRDDQQDDHGERNPEPAARAAFKSTHRQPPPVAAIRPSRSRGNRRSRSRRRPRSCHRGRRCHGRGGRCAGPTVATSRPSPGRTPARRR